MTATAGVRTEAQRLRIRFAESVDAGSLGQMAARFRGLEQLMIVAYWSQVSRNRELLNPSASLLIRRNLTVAQLSYNSPLDVVLALPPLGLVYLAVGRGAVRLLSGWQDYREKRAETDYRVAAYNYLKNSIPQSLPPALSSSEEARTPEQPRDLEVRWASEVLVELEYIDLEGED